MDIHLERKKVVFLSAALCVSMTYRNIDPNFFIYQIIK